MVPGRRDRRGPAATSQGTAFFGWRCGCGTCAACMRRSAAMTAARGSGGRSPAVTGRSRRWSRPPNIAPDLGRDIPSSVPAAYPAAAREPGRPRFSSVAAPASQAGQPAPGSPFFQVRPLGAERSIGSVPGVYAGRVRKGAEDLVLQAGHEAVEVHGLCCPPRTAGEHRVAVALVGCCHVGSISGTLADQPKGLSTRWILCYPVTRGGAQKLVYKLCLGTVEHLALPGRVS